MASILGTQKSTAFNDYWFFIYSIVMHLYVLYIVCK